MHRIILGLALACLCCVANATETYRFRDGVVSTGDSIAALVKRAGQPSRIVQLQNRYGAAVGERWDYYIDDKVVSFEISGGKIVAIIETR